MTEEFDDDNTSSPLPFYALYLIPLFILFVTGISLWRIPEKELLYEVNVQRHCLPENCITRYAIEFGNTGKTEIALVQVSINHSVLETTIIKPAVLKFGKIPMSFATRQGNDNDIISFGPLERGKNVSLTFTTDTPPNTESPASEVIVRVQADDVPVLRGSPNLTRFGRVLTGILQLF